MSAAESPDAQKRGVMAIFYLLDYFNFKSVNDNLRKSIPLHFASFQVCYNDENEFKLICGALKTLNTKTQVRYRSHFGTYAEEHC
jgi:hypothetical protein